MRGVTFCKAVYGAIFVLASSVMSPDAFAGVQTYYCEIANMNDRATAVDIDDKEMIFWDQKDEEGNRGTRVYSFEEHLKPNGGKKSLLRYKFNKKASEVGSGNTSNYLVQPTLLSGGQPLSDKSFEGRRGGTLTVAQENGTTNTIVCYER